MINLHYKTEVVCFPVRHCVVVTPSSLLQSQPCSIVQSL